jgi:hypothetical protein
MDTQDKTQNPPANEPVDITELLKSIKDEVKQGSYDAEKFQNSEDVKKIS